MQRRPARILIVEDDELLRETLAGLLEYEGYAIRTARDTRMALGMLGIERPDIVLVDVDRALSEADLQRVRSFLGPDSLPPLVAMSSMPGPPKKDLGLSAWLTKPFDLDTLLDVIEPHLGSPHASGRRAVP